MHVLVTGGTGFIGRPLCRALIERGDTLSVLTRSIAHAARVLPAATRAIESLDALGAGDPVDAIVNLAGENLADRRWSATQKQQLTDSRVQATRRLVEWIGATQPRPRVLVSGSAIGWYGARGDEPLAEQSTSGKAEEFQAQLCRAWESEAQRCEKLGLRVCRLRTGVTLARDGGPLKKMLLPFRLGLGGPLGDGRQWLSWIHREDLVALILWLLDHERATGAWNGTAPNPVTNREFVQALGAALHRPAALPMPAFALRLVAGEMAELLLTGQKVLPARALEAGFAFRHPELPGALAEILAS